MALRSRVANHAGAFSTHSTENVKGENNGSQECTLAYLDFALQRLVVEALVLALDGREVDLGARDDDADERAVVGAEPLHGVTQARREPRRRVLHALHCERRG